MQAGEPCPECGREIPADAPGGLCPVCLLRGALDVGPDEGETADAADTPDPAAGLGLRFGPYTTLRILGEGGMGIVYLARQNAPIQRTVALKVIKPGFDSHQVVARFESERQALAMMDHPGIARVFDAGETPDHRPYFAMEYVSGIPITEYCDARRLNNRQRLELFGEVCQAIHHAHRKGIIHRDIKPSNVLVSNQDGIATPKVIDFGIAKATGFHLTDRTLYTEQGLLMGTPEYMSPEQAGPDPHDVDTATDIYSLGVLLYELLVGALPFEARELRRAGYLAMLRVIREEEPPTLARRLEALGAQATQIAERRHTDAHSLAREVRGDLEWITLRALEKERHRRYGSVSELAADIARHLHDEPVLAGPPGRGYRLRKFVRKHRFGVGAAAAILLCLVAGLTASTILYFREQRQRDIAERQSYEANLANADALIDASDVEVARERLFQCPPRLRGWEWRLLYAQSDNSVATLRGEGDPLPDGANSALYFGFSSDGRRLFSHVYRTVHSWEVPSWAPVATYGVFAPVLAMSGDGSRIVTRALRKQDPELYVVEPSSGKRITVLRGHLGALTAAFSANGDRVATGSGDGAFRIWEAASGRLLVLVGPQTGPLRPDMRLVFSPNGRHIARIFRGTLQLFDAHSGRVLHTMSCRATAYGVAFSPDGKHVATGDMNPLISLWNVESGQLERSWSEVNGTWAVAYSPDGNTLATASQNGAVHVWDTASGSAIATLTGPRTILAAVAFSPDGKWILASSTTGEVWIWDSATYGGSVLSRAATRMAVSRDGARVALNGRQGTMVVDALSGRRLQQGLPRVGDVPALSPAGDRLAEGGRDGSLRVSDVVAGSPIWSLAGHSGYVMSLDFSPDGRYLASGSWDRTARIWDAATGSNLAKLSLSEPVYRVAFSPNGKYLATGAGDYTMGPMGKVAFDGGLRLWDVPSGRLVRSFRSRPATGESITALAFSPDGSRLAAGDSCSGHIRIVDPLGGQVVAELPGTPSRVMSALAFSSDGRLLADAANDCTIRLWDTFDGRTVFTLRRPAKIANGLTFSPDGRKLYASYNVNLPVRVWSVSTAYDPNARELIARLSRQYPVTADVRHHIENDRSLDESQRATALRLCPWRLNSDQVTREILWEPLLRPRDSASERDLLLRRADDLYRALPWSVEAWTVLGAAQYRNGLYREAAATLVRASEAAYADPRADAFLAMAHYRLGEATKSRASLERARELLKEAEPVPQHHGLALLSEAEALLAGKR